MFKFFRGLNGISSLEKDKLQRLGQVFLQIFISDVYQRDSMQLTAIFAFGTAVDLYLSYSRQNTHPERTEVNAMQRSVLLAGLPFFIARSLKVEPILPFFAYFAANPAFSIVRDYTNFGKYL
jgi:hypothetical protein